jgi:hypothetical protein
MGASASGTDATLWQTELANPVISVVRGKNLKLMTRIL